MQRVQGAFHVWIACGKGHVHQATKSHLIVTQTFKIENRSGAGDGRSVMYGATELLSGPEFTAQLAELGRMQMA